MGTKKSKVDTSALFRGIVGHDESEAPEVNSGEAEAAAKLPVAGEVKAAPVKVGRKANKEKNIQVSIYLTPDQAKELRVQDALKEKETDKSAIARTGIEIALSLNKETYAAMKVAADKVGKTPGQIVQKALEQYL